QVVSRGGTPLAPPPPGPPTGPSPAPALVSRTLKVREIRGRPRTDGRSGGTICYATRGAGGRGRRPAGREVRGLEAALAPFCGSEAVAGLPVDPSLRQCPCRAPQQRPSGEPRARACFALPERARAGAPLGPGAGGGRRAGQPEAEVGLASAPGRCLVPPRLETPPSAGTHWLLGGGGPRRGGPVTAGLASQVWEPPEVPKREQKNLSPVLVT
ncbi:Laminin Subunit Beta-1, partial [Manis pentadactyla]